MWWWYLAKKKGVAHFVPLAIRSAGPLPESGYLWTEIGHFPEAGR